MTPPRYTWYVKIWFSFFISPSFFPSSFLSLSLPLLHQHCAFFPLLYIVFHAFSTLPLFNFDFSLRLPPFFVTFFMVWWEVSRFHFLVPLTKYTPCHPSSIKIGLGSFLPYSFLFFSFLLITPPLFSSLHHLFSASQSYPSRLVWSGLVRSIFIFYPFKSRTSPFYLHSTFHLPPLLCALSSPNHLTQYLLPSPN